ncbi:MAG: GntR family transcriptional regulator [Gammaproteobacteria bacterium]|nr:GntR family transcriptional regulator [Gammaproteobacteria bacterium]
MKGFERPKTAQEAVLLEIRKRLLDGRLQPGQAIRPDAVGEELGMSAVPVREALRILEGEGQVRYRPHRGYLVTDLDLKDLREIYGIRELLETEAVRHAIPKISDSDLEEMREAIEEMESAGDDIFSLTTANRAFHFTLFEAAEMPHLTRIVTGLWDVSEPCHYRSRGFMRRENRDQVDAEHRRIMDAVAARDVERVVAELVAHQRHALAALETSLDSD